MKRLLFIPLLFLSLLTGANTYYVSTTGSDSNPGTLASPWATWQKAFDTAEAGDTVYFRGGTWYPVSKADGWAITSINPNGGHGNNGTYNNPICFFNYPGEIPILDCSLACLPTEGNTGLGVTGAEYIHFKGLTIRNVRQMEDNEGDNATGFYATDCTGVIWYTNMTTHNNEGVGTWFRTYDTIYLTNCDSYLNNDSLDNASPSGGADGFALSSRGEAVDTFKLTVVTGCRSWQNADDGFDIGSTKQLQFYNNWAWSNGYIGAGSAPSGTGGDGVGLKVSYSHVALTDKRKVYNNIFAYNIGMDQEAGAGIAEVNLYDEGDFGPVLKAFNNFFYHNFTGMGSALSWGWANYPTPYYNDILTNNLVYEYDYDYPAYFRAVNYTQGDPSYVHLTTNTFYLPGIYGNCVTNPAYTVTDDDFVSLDTAQLRGERLADGSLPYITFGRLEDASDLDSAGTDVGLSTVPSIGVDWAYLAGATDSTLKYILSYSFDEQTGVAVIDTSAKTVDIEVEYGTDVTGLIATFSLSIGATAAVGATPQVSGTTANDFTSPVTYVITALDETTQNWTITVTVDSEPTPTVATVATTSANYNAYKASVTGRIYSANGGTLTARGVCYSTTNSSPTIADRRTIYTPYVGSFTDVIRGLKGGITVYVRAYAVTQEGGASYGDMVSFTTPAQTVVTHGGLPPIINGLPVIIK